jgi:hypothetical protein
MFFQNLLKNICFSGTFKCNSTNNFLSVMTPLFQNITNELYQHLTAKPTNFSSSTVLNDSIKSDPNKKEFIDMAVKLGLSKDSVIF